MGDTKAQADVAAVQGQPQERPEGDWDRFDPGNRPPPVAAAARVFTLVVPPNQSVQIRFLGGPIQVYQHYLRNLATKRKFYFCLQQKYGKCPICRSGNGASERGAFLVIDRRPDKFKNSQGEEIVTENPVRVALPTWSDVNTLQQLHEKVPLWDVDYLIMRSGSGTNTRYNYVPLTAEQSLPLTEEQIELRRNWRPMLEEAIAPPTLEEAAQLVGGHLEQEDTEDSEEQTFPSGQAGGAAPPF